MEKISIDKNTKQIKLNEEEMQTVADELLKQPSFVKYVTSKLQTSNTLPQQSSWQNMDSLSLQTIYSVDNKEVNAKLLFSVRGGYPRITVFTDMDNINRDTIINAKFNYRRIDQLFTLMGLYIDTEKNGKLFTYTTNNVEYVDNKPTSNVIEEAKVTLSIKDGVYLLSVTNDKLPVIHFPITNQYEVYGKITNELNQELDESTDSTIAFKSLVERLKYIFRSLEVIYLRETQSKPLDKKINHIG